MQYTTASCNFVDKSSPQVSLLSKVIQRYFTVGFQGMGTLSNFSGNDTPYNERQRKLKMIAILLDALILFFQFLYHGDNTFK